MVVSQHTTSHTAHGGGPTYNITYAATGAEPHTTSHTAMVVGPHTTSHTVTGGGPTSNIPYGYGHPWQVPSSRGVLVETMLTRFKSFQNFIF